MLLLVIFERRKKYMFFSLLLLKTNKYGINFLPGMIGSWLNMLVAQEHLMKSGL